MQATPSITDWLQAGSAMVTAAISFFVLYQLRLTQQQIRLAREEAHRTVTWNKLNATFTFLNDSVFSERERAAAEYLNHFGIELIHATEPLNRGTVEQLRNDFEACFHLKALLNLMEDWATAVKVGLVDHETAYATISGQFIRYGGVLMPFIESHREITNDDEFYIEFERIYLEWKARSERDREIHHREMESARLQAETRIAEAKQKLQASKGATKRY
jgi:hypothetical protein